MISVQKHEIYPEQIFNGKSYLTGNIEPGLSRPQEVRQKKTNWEKQLFFIWILVPG
jgi:hypothetical protein